MPSRHVSVPKRPSRSQWLLCLSALLSLVVFASDAGATPEYPIVLDSYLRMQNPQHTDCDQLTRCLICHTTTRGGQATAVRPFAQTLSRYGLNRGRDSGALLNALAMLPATTDSDDDGLADIDELTLCGNPSGADIGSGPQYGCDGAQLVPARSTDYPLALLALFVAGLIVHRRRAPTLAG
jgi:hypothetical protein